MIDTAIPMYISATEPTSGEFHLFSPDSKIKLPCAIAISMVTPCVFDPRDINNKNTLMVVGSDIPAKETQMFVAPDQQVLAANIDVRADKVPYREVLNGATHIQ